MELIDVRRFYSAAPAQARLIPNQVYQTWRTPWFDAGHAQVLRNCRDANPTFGFHFFDDQQMSDYMKSVWGNHIIYRIFEKTRIGASRADIWRYCILFER